jgi:hypothetical protein
MAGFPFMRQAEAFRSSLPFILLLAVFILPCPMSAAAKPRPAIAFVHLLLPPGGEPHASPAGWIGSLDRARDTLESLRIPTIVSSASPGNAEDLNELSEMDPEVLITTSPLLYAAACDVAKRSPNTVFFACTDETVHDNMSGFQARTYEAHYLAGLIAGALSEDGVIGYLANDPYQSKASRLRNANAFTLGAQKSKAAIRVLYAPGNDPDEELKTLIAAGADIVDLERALPSLVERLREHSVRYASPRRNGNGAMPSEICSRRYVSASGGRATSLTASKKASWGFPPSARPYPKPCGFVSVRRRRPSVTGLPHSRGLSAMFPGPCALRKGASRMTQPCAAWTGESKGWSLFRSHRTAYKGKGFKDARSRGKAFYEGASSLFQRIRLFYILYRKTSLKKAAPY